MITAAVIGNHEDWTFTFISDQIDRDHDLGLRGVMFLDCGCQASKRNEKGLYEIGDFRDRGKIPRFPSITSHFSPLTSRRACHFSNILAKNFVAITKILVTRVRVTLKAEGLRNFIASR